MAAADLHDHSGVISVTVPSGGYTKGNIYALNSGALVVALETKAAAATCLVLTTKNAKEVVVNKATGSGRTFSIGSKVYWSSSTKTVTNVASGNTLCGTALEAAVAATSTLKILFGSLV